MLAGLSGLPAECQKLLHKGKEPAGASTLCALGVKKGAKMMLLRGKKLKNPPGGGKRPKPAAPVDAAALLAAPAPEPEPAARPAAVAQTVFEEEPGGAEAALLTVSHGRVRLKLRFDAGAAGGTTLLLLREKVALHARVPLAQQRLVWKGAVLEAAAQDALTLGAIGLRDGAKLLLVGNEAYHKADAERAYVAKCERQLADAAQQVRGVGGLLKRDAAAAVVALAKLEGELAMSKARPAAISRLGLC